MALDYSSGPDIITALGGSGGHSDWYGHSSSVASDISMASGSGSDHVYPHSFQWQYGPWTPSQIRDALGP